MNELAEKALERRVRRHLSKSGKALRKVRTDSQWYAQYGPYMVVDAATNFSTEYGITDLESLLST
jgi:hypothetical protein